MPRVDIVAIESWFDMRKRAERLQDEADKDFERLNMKSVVETLAARGFNPTERLVDIMPQLNVQQQAKVLQALAEMGQRELVAEKREIKHEGLGLLDILEAQSRKTGDDD